MRQLLSQALAQEGTVVLAYPFTQQARCLGYRPGPLSRINTDQPTFSWRGFAMTRVGWF